MSDQDKHISDEELLSAADGEISARRIAKIRAHLASCWSCRARLAEMEATIKDFVRLHNDSLDPLVPPPGDARRLLQLRLTDLGAADLGAAEPQGRWWRLDRRKLILGYSLIAVIAAAVFLLLGTPAENSRVHAQTVPDPSLTPGAALPVTREDVCAAGTAETVRLVPAHVAMQVFAAYGIHEPRPRAYELDYLISPALGGSDNIRNFWPQPYGSTVWNAHIKDALEDHLYRLVCSGELDLATAQRDISQDWIGAYKKYFRTESPLSSHASFLKDRPWE